MRHSTASVSLALPSSGLCYCVLLNGGLSRRCTSLSTCACTRSRLRDTYFGCMCCSEAPPARQPNQYSTENYAKESKQIGGRFISRAVRVNYFRFRLQVNKNIQVRELRGQGKHRPKGA